MGLECETLHLNQTSHTPSSSSLPGKGKRKRKVVAMTNETASLLACEDQGAPLAADQLFLSIYDQLRELAARRLAKEIPGQTLQATALVHEAYIRLIDTDNVQEWNSRGHFFAAVARAMRRILIDNARRKRAQIRGGDMRRVEISEEHWISRATPEQIASIDESLSRLSEEDPEVAKLVELRLFADMPLEEAGRCLGMSRAKAYRLWRYARARLLAERQD